MHRKLGWKLILIVVVIALSVWGFYPPGQKINLGLDLRGGIHLVMRVRTDDALRRETETTVERLREALSRNSVAFSSVELTSPTTFRVEGVHNDEALRRAAAEADGLYERSVDASGLTYRMRADVTARVRDETVAQALQTIERRVNELGAVEPIVARYGTGDRILVQLPGIHEVERAKDVISSTARLELKLVEQGPFATEQLARHAYGGDVPPDLEILAGPGDAGAAGSGAPATEHYVVRRVAVVTGSDLRNARPSLDRNNLPAVSFSLNQEGARRFAPFTEQNIGRRLAIVLDERVISAPTIEGRIPDEGQIYGRYTAQQAQDLSLMLRSGALPANLDYLQQQTIGPSLGRDSIRAGITASIGGLAMVVLFLLFYYRLAGLNAATALAVNLVILLGVVAYLGRTLTLPGIAGVILTIGMGVDSNVLIFERIREELVTAKSVRAAVKAGFDRVWRTIVDTHVSSLIAAAVLFQFGTGPIRGFATTWAIGLLANMFSSVFVSRTLFELLLTMRRDRPLGI